MLASTRRQSHTTHSWCGTLLRCRFIISGCCSNIFHSIMGYDSGAVNHVTSIRSEFIPYKSQPSLGIVKVTNGNRVKVLGEGTIDVNHTITTQNSDY